MLKLTLKIDGMMCGMCENHINDTIRKNFAVKKVTSSHSKGKTEIVTENPISQEDLQKAIGEMGYTLVNMQREPYIRKLSKSVMRIFFKAQRLAKANRIYY